MNINLNDDNLLKKKNFVIIRDPIDNDSQKIEKSVEKIIKVEVKNENFNNSYLSYSPIKSLENQKLAELNQLSQEKFNNLVIIFVKTFESPDNYFIQYFQI